MQSGFLVGKTLHLGTAFLQNAEEMFYVQGKLLEVIFKNTCFLLMYQLFSDFIF